MWDWKRLAHSLSTLTLTRGERNRLAHRGRNANYGLLCLHVAHSNTPIWSCNYKLVIHVFMVRRKHKSARLQDRKKQKIKSKQGEILHLWLCNDRIWLCCGTEGAQHRPCCRRQGLSAPQEARTGQSAPESSSSRVVSGRWSLLRLLILSRQNPSTR